MTRTAPATRTPINCPGPVGLNRRTMLPIGSIGALNLTMPQLLAANDRLAKVGQSAIGKIGRCSSFPKARRFVICSPEARGMASPNEILARLR